MRDPTPPFKFDLRKPFSGLRALPLAVEGVSLTLPFLTVTIKPEDRERRIAREVVIRMADRRVLNAFECCNNCIEHALASLHEIRRLLVDKEVELAGHTHSGLYLLLELMADAIRQFFTFVQHLGSGHERQPVYFAALEVLRGHLHRVLLQVAKIADIEIPNISPHMRYDESWQLEAYAELKQGPTPTGGPISSSPRGDLNHRRT